MTIKGYFHGISVHSAIGGSFSVSRPSDSRWHSLVLITDAIRKSYMSVWLVASGPSTIFHTSFSSGTKAGEVNTTSLGEATTGALSYKSLLCRRAWGAFLKSLEGAVSASYFFVGLVVEFGNVFGVAPSFL